MQLTTEPVEPDASRTADGGIPGQDPDWHLPDRRDPAQVRGAGGPLRGEEVHLQVQGQAHGDCEPGWLQQSVRAVPGVEDRLHDSSIFAVEIQAEFCSCFDQNMPKFEPFLWPQFWPVPVQQYRFSRDFQ